MNLKPYKVDVQFHYKCPNCGAEWQQSFAEVKHIGKIVCYCEKLLLLEKMDGLTITPKYHCDNRTISAVRVVNTATTTLNCDVEDTVKAMKKMGFKAEEAKLAVNQVINTGEKYKGENEFVQACIQTAYNLKRII